MAQVEARTSDESILDISFIDASDRSLVATAIVDMPVSCGYHTMQWTDNDMLVVYYAANDYTNPPSGSDYAVHVYTTGATRINAVPDCRYGGKTTSGAYSSTGYRVDGLDGNLPRFDHVGDEGGRYLVCTR